MSIANVQNTAKNVAASVLTAVQPAKHEEQAHDIESQDAIEKSWVAKPSRPNLTLSGLDVPGTVTPAANGLQPVGGGRNGAVTGALVGLIVGSAICVPLGVPLITNESDDSYHSKLGGILVMAIGIPVITIIGAAIGACLGKKGTSKAFG